MEIVVDLNKPYNCPFCDEFYECRYAPCPEEQESYGCYCGEPTQSWCPLRKEPVIVKARQDE